jgi:hypothetical protein
MTTPFQQSPFLRQQRNFPHDNPQALGVELDKSYIDIAIKVNARTIGLFAIGNQIVTGEAWYLTGSSQKQQTLRQIYRFTSTGNIAHGINFVTVAQVTKPSGSYTDGTNWYGAIYASSVAIAGQVTFYVTPTNIVVLAGAGAPSIVSGTIILEWLSVF